MAAILSGVGPAAILWLGRHFVKLRTSNGGPFSPHPPKKNPHADLLKVAVNDWKPLGLVWREGETKSTGVCGGGGKTVLSILSQLEFVNVLDGL